MKKLFAILMTICLVVPLVACGGGDKNADDGVFDICVASEPQSIDPALNSAIDGYVMLSANFEGLVKWVDKGDGKAVLAPGQAESWDVSDDKLTYTFHLRDGIKWSDGKPVTADDFVYSWNRVVAEKTAADYEYMLAMVEGYDSKVLKVKAVDDKTFEVKLNAPCQYFEEICAFPATYPVRKDVVEGNEQWTTNPETYISNGKYVMTNWTHNSEITFEKNKEYYDNEKVKVPTLKFHLMDDANAIYAAYQAGKLDYVQEFPQDEVPALIKDKKITIADYLGTYFVTFQVTKAPFDNPKVREAFSLAIDRNFVVNKVSQRGEVAADGFVPNGTYDAKGADGPGFREVAGPAYSVAEDQYKANVEKAKKLLAEAGYPNGEGFPTVEYLYNTNDNHKAIGEALQNMWQTELGVKVNLKNQDWNVFLTERKKGNFDIARGGWIADYNDPMSFLDMYVTGGGNNDPQYSNADYDKLIADARVESDSAKRMDLLHKAENKILKEDVIMAPIYFYTNPYMLQDGYEGLYNNVLGGFFFDQMELKQAE